MKSLNNWIVSWTNLLQISYSVKYFDQRQYLLIISQPDITSGINLTFSVSDRQFIFFLDYFAKSPKAKSNIFRCDWKDFNKDNLISDFNDLNWTELLEIDKNSVILSIKMNKLRFNNVG